MANRASDKQTQNTEERSSLMSQTWLQKDDLEPDIHMHNKYTIDLPINALCKDIACC